MKSDIGKQLNYDEVKELKDGTKIWIESDFPERNVFIGIKKDKVITSIDEKVKWAIGEDFKVLCKAFEWKPRFRMDEIEIELAKPRFRMNVVERYISDLGFKGRI